MGFFEVLFGVTAILESGRVGPELEEESAERDMVPRVRTEELELELMLALDSSNLDFSHLILGNNFWNSLALSQMAP